MEKDKIITTPNGQSPANDYDDGNIPREDLPGNVIPDEVPRRDGPCGESGKSNLAVDFSLKRKMQILRFFPCCENAIM